MRRRVISHNEDTGGGKTQKVKNADLAAMWTASKKNNPERVLADDLIICQGPYVIVRTTIHSSDTTGFAGNPPTGQDLRDQRDRHLSIRKRQGCRALG